MTKKNVDKTEEIEDTSISDLEKMLSSKYGEGIIIPGSRLITSPKKQLSISPCIDLSTGGGIYEGSWAGFAGAPGCGKAQPLYSTVFTPNGPVKMGDISVGQLVSLPNGKHAKVIGVYPQGIKSVYEITFSDGSKTRCCDEHLWKVDSQNGYKCGILSTRDIRKKIKMNDGKRIYSIQTTNPVEFYEKKHIIHPYLLGILISEGNFQASLKFSTSDIEILDKVKKIIPKGYSLKQINQYDYRISRLKYNGRYIINPVLSDEIKKLGLAKKLSFEKFIPEDYLIDSIENRMELIRGLMDGDGTTYKSGYGCTYSTSSKQLAENFKFLIQSIGGKCTISEKNTTYIYKGKKLNGRVSYICFISVNNMKELFSLPRKKDRLIEKTKRFTKRFIDSIEYIGEEDTQCIMVDSDEHLYLTDEFIVTHNTTLCLQIAKNAQIEGRPVFYINVEARLKKMNLEGIKGLDPDKVHVINYVENRALTGEDFLTIIENIIKSVRNAVIIIDSVSSLCPSDELTKDITGSIRPTTPKMLSHFIKKNTGSVYINNSIILMIHHVITNTSGYGAKWQISDGVKVNFQADVRLQAKGTPADWKEGETQIGQIVEWDISKSGNSASVGTTRSFIRYGIGIDESAEVFNLCVDMGIIKKGGAWYECSHFSTEEKQFKIQGQEKFLKFLGDNPEKLELLRGKIMELA